MQYAFQSDIGRHRKDNQDRVDIITKEDQVLAVVCDGMGGHLAGELAAQMVLDSILASFLEHAPFLDNKQACDWVASAVRGANHLVYADAYVHAEHAGMGTTLVGVLMMPKEMVVFHVGDSRLYTCQEQLTQRTEDHTYVNMLLKSGSISPWQARYHPQRNILVKAVGVFEDLIVSLQLLPREKQLLLLCSDGLYNCLDEHQIQDILKAGTSVVEKCEELILRANEQGGYDNITVALIDDPGGEEYEP